MKQRVAAVVPARNVENIIGMTLSALFGQHTRPSRVIVVKDGSTDRTADSASAAGAEVVDMPDRGYHEQGTYDPREVTNMECRLWRIHTKS